ncbi:MAG TPA: phage tail sheath subtilisin-like domain-containing protein [Candidatus Thiothrix moscowensis]|uniref:phage tail sheath family protein n=1 Tax=Thiothrix sp. UBA2016 TaxID=1947695 RepID=UPI0025FC599B|nr:phage tail sheath subtilisin-like domain-containing protein [Thiothrix sp. UBA2016]HRJ53107.1 phage tail sheath subtilisin-like domain-containing protein [Candidatus Thiothrix moscowensis]HRJ93098.1 phage tail sheath subtilisin-like domain-containing protein [Candidatus Thiothrix moscowensis]
MPVALSYPGVYIQEIPSGVRTITGVATSITAFIGRAKRGPVNKAVTINSFGDFERTFGGMWLDSTASFAIRDFFLNGGGQAVFVRLFHPLFADETQRTTAEAAAKAVADAAKGKANGKEAIEAAEAEHKKISDDRSKTSIEKTAASDALAIINTLDDDAKKEDIEKTADYAVIKSASNNIAKLSIGDIKLEAASPGSWGVNLRCEIDRNGISDTNLFNLTVSDIGNGITERFLNLSVADASQRRADKILAGESKLVKWDGGWSAIDLTTTRTAITAFETDIKDDKTQTQDNMWGKTLDQITLKQKQYLRIKSKRETTAETSASDPEKTAKKAWEDAIAAQSASVSDGLALSISDFLPENGQNKKMGLYALEQLYSQGSLFNILCLPPHIQDGDIESNLSAAAAAYCEYRRAMLLVDPPSGWKDKDAAKAGFTGVEDQIGTRSKNAALFFPRIKQPNPLRGNQMEEFVPCGTVAGIFARTDATRGVWKAPAGLEATLNGVPQLSAVLTDEENGELNQLGINCLRVFPVLGRIVWGSRTLQGADQLTSEWKYIPVRRTALFIEESLYRGTQWVVFEPNDEPLWAQIRLNIGAFMHSLFRQGAFQGSSPKDAYFVKCDKETTTQDDINRGIVNIHVGFAPLKPAEFVVISIQQMAGQIQV